MFNIVFILVFNTKIVDNKRETRQQDCPYQSTQIQYGPKSQLIPQDNPDTSLNKKGEQYIRQVFGSLLYYDCAVDLPILFTQSTIAARQLNPTDKTMELTQQFLDYPNTKNRY